MPQRYVLTVPVNDLLTLDAGWWEHVQDEDGRTWRVVHPPAKTMFEQLLNFLDHHPTPRPISAYPRNGGEEWATVALCVRWGSYFAVLADPSKPITPEAKNELLSRVSDAEMARINIEASAALAAWIEIRHTEPERYQQLLWAVRRWLPMRRWTIDSQPENTRISRVLYNLAFVEAATLQALQALYAADFVQRRQEEIARHATRVFANAVINATYRNNCPIEDIHAGRGGAHALLQSRITPAEERTITSGVAGRMRGAFSALRMVDHHAQQGDRQKWIDFVQPYHFADFHSVTPSEWSLTEVTREIRLYGEEPPSISLP